MSEEMTSTKPYLLRAFYEWILDNDCTPYVVVDAEAEYVQVPRQYVDEEGNIILNVGPIAVQGLRIGNDALEFNARFSGAAMHIYAPIPSVHAIYARENGRGLVFAEEESMLGEDFAAGLPPEVEAPLPSATPKVPPKKGRPHLTVVSGGKDNDKDE